MPLLAQLLDRLLGSSDSWSVWSLRRLFDRLSADDRVRGAVLRVQCSATPAVCQSLRTILLRFRARGKHLVAYGDSFTPFQYYLACACDSVLMPPSAEWGVTGFASEFIFLKDALDRIGVRAEAIQVSPFKSAFDALTRSDFSAESRAQAEWLLDARYDALVRAVAESRKLDVARVQALIDVAPLGADEAVQCGLLDAALHEDQLEDFLKSRFGDVPARQKPRRLQRVWMQVAERLPAEFRRQLQQQSEDAARLIAPFSRAQRALVRLEPPRRAGEVAVVEIRGLIAEGKSRHLPFPSGLNEVSGAEDVAEQLRRLARDAAIKAVVLHVNSNGGSALASDLIARELRQLRARKPVVAYMSGVAASGGYYVAALANHIVAQPLTITGSIGVISLKLETQQALQRLGVNSVVLRRGRRAALLIDTVPLDADGREALTRSVQRVYERFKQIVAEGRALSLDELEPICGGRVWTGAQALERRLVDALGDITDAIAKARALAALSPDPHYHVRLYSAPRAARFSLPLLFGSLNSLRDLMRRERLWLLSPFIALPD